MHRIGRPPQTSKPQPGQSESARWPTCESQLTAESCRSSIRLAALGPSSRCGESAFPRDGSEVVSIEVPGQFPMRERVRQPVHLARALGLAVAYALTAAVGL